MSQPIPPISLINLIKPTLFATFYGDIKQQTTLNKLFGYFKRLTPQQTDGQWHNDDESIHLLRFTPPATYAGYDTEVIQLIINDLPSSTVPWQDSLKQLCHSLRNNWNCLDALWGYTLVYRATTSSPLNKHSHLAKDLTDELHSLKDLANRPTVSVPRIPKARSQLEHGWLWLLDIPSGHGVNAGTIYLALSPDESAASQLETNTLADETASLLMPDLIAHKGYYEYRQYYAGNQIKNLEKKLTDVTAHTRKLWQTWQPILNLPAQIGVDLNYLLKDYRDLASTVIPKFNEFYLSVARHKANYVQQWQEAEDKHIFLGVNEIPQDVFAFHQRNLESSLAELSLLLTQTRDAEERVKIVLESTRTESELTRAQQEFRFGLLLALLGTGLAVSQIADSEVAAALLEWSFFSYIITWLNNTFGLTLNADHRLDQLAMQLVITLIVTFILALIWQIAKRWLK